MKRMGGGRPDCAGSPWNRMSRGLPRRPAEPLLGRRPWQLGESNTSRSVGVGLAAARSLQPVGHPPTESDAHPVTGLVVRTSRLPRPGRRALNSPAGTRISATPRSWVTAGVRGFPLSASTATTVSRHAGADTTRTRKRARPPVCGRPFVNAAASEVWRPSTSEATRATSTWWSVSVPRRCLDLAVARVGPAGRIVLLLHGRWRPVGRRTWPAPRSWPCHRRWSSRRATAEGQIARAPVCWRTRTSDRVAESWYRLLRRAGPRTPRRAFDRWRVEGGGARRWPAEQRIWPASSGGLVEGELGLARRF